MESSERTKLLMHDASVWTKPDGTASLVIYSIRQSMAYNVVIIQTVESLSTISHADIQAMGEVKNIRRLFSSADQTLRKILSYTNDYTVWSLCEVPILDRWVSDDAAMVLIGDAAHAMAPHLAQGAAMAIEDSIVLADCLRRIRSKDDLAVALGAYQSLRKLRVEAVAAVSRDLAAARAAIKNKNTGAASDTLQQGVGDSGKAFSIVELYSYDGLQETEHYFLDNPGLLKI
jgi:2-polyprenyl-6-methoxyphenol hydroxylase-like FAD-dependent oxidoreductase